MNIITLSDIGLSYGTKDVLKSVSFMLNSGDKLGIIGVNGAGKSTLFRIIS
ncbi:MAG: ATP-binding cassette domain-containing protein, partial [Clostridia bacterium]|nr:ATP-binding cassette domain-containing protein [Clostridia bacterium]